MGSRAVKRSPDSPQSMRTAAVTLFFSAAALTALGMVMLVSASTGGKEANYLLMQPLWCLLGMIACFGAATLDYAECTIECKMADLLDAEEKRQTPMQLFVGGKLKITGNVQIAMALAGVFT